MTATSPDKRDQLIETLRRHQLSTIETLAELTGFSVSAVRDILFELQSEGKVFVTPGRLWRWQG